MVSEQPRSAIANKESTISGWFLQTIGERCEAIGLQVNHNDQTAMIKEKAVKNNEDEEKS